MPDTINIDLISEYRTMHEAGHFKGLTLLRFAKRIGEICEETGAQTLLDFGCGKGEQYIVHKAHEMPGWPGMPVLYDPAVPAYASSLGSNDYFDGVICTDVLEHIPGHDIPGFLHDLYSRARSFVFLTVCTRPAKKHLPCGLNCHVTIRPMQWWIDMIYRNVPPDLRVELEWNE